MQSLESAEVIEQLGMPYIRAQSSFDELSDDVIYRLLDGGTILKLNRGEYIARFDEAVSDFQIILKGRLAYYKHWHDRDVLIRHFDIGNQVGFDEMIGLINRDGTDVAIEETLLLSISSELFFELHVAYPGEFGVLMINLARELSREIEVLEDVIRQGTGWAGQPGTGT